MIEAYEIGITLALDNGVASGVAAIRHDLDTLDRAVARSSAGLNALRSLSATLPSAGLMPSGIPSATPAYPPQQPPTHRLTPVSSDTSSPPDASTAPFAAIAPTPQPRSSPMSSIELAQSILTTAPGMPASSGQRPPSQLAPLGTNPLMPPSMPPVELGNPIASPVPAKAYPPTRATPGTPAVPGLPQPPSTSPEFSPFPAFKPATPVEPISRQPAPLRPSAAQLPVPTATALPASAPVRRIVPPQQVAAAPDSQFVPVPSRPAAPLALPHRPVWPTRPETPLSPSMAATASASAPSHIVSPLHGEIILDGARLGRWISDRLTRAVDRPTSGTTGFDPRISHSHAGAPNGSQ